MQMSIFIPFDYRYPDSGCTFMLDVTNGDLVLTSDIGTLRFRHTEVDDIVEAINIMQKFGRGELTYEE